MTEILTFDEIRERYAPDWVLLGDIETDEHLTLLSGRVLHHGPDREEVTLKGLNYPPGRYAVRFLGKFPEDVEFVLGSSLRIEPWADPGRV